MRRWLASVAGAALLAGCAHVDAALGRLATAGMPPAPTATPDPRPLYITVGACEQETGWTRQACEGVMDRKVFVGMTAAQVKAAWWLPTAINTTATASGVTEQWVYRSDDASDAYVYLTNGVVTAIQASE